MDNNGFLGVVGRYQEKRGEGCICYCDNYKYN